MNKHQNLQILPLINHYPLNFLIDYIYIIPCILFFLSKIKYQLVLITLLKPA